MSALQQFVRTIVSADDSSHLALQQSMNDQTITLRAVAEHQVLMFTMLKSLNENLVLLNDAISIILAETLKRRRETLIAE